MTTAQVSVMAVVSAGSTVTQRDVAGALGVNESAVTAMVQRLEGLGCVRREQHPDDARAWTLHLTDDGQAALTTAQRSFAPVNQLIEETLSTGEIAALADALGRLAAAFDAHRDEAGGKRGAATFRSGTVAGVMVRRTAR